MSQLLRSAAACAALMFLPTPAGAQIYECTDASGAREYAQVCAAGTVRQRQLRADDPPAGTTDTKTVPQLDAEFRKRQGERREADEKALDERNKRAKEIQKTRDKIQKERKGGKDDGSGAADEEDEEKNFISLMEKEKQRRLLELPKLRPAD